MGSPERRVDEELISQHLYTAGLPDPDLLIRTSGEMRVSNFLLWQIAYAEIYVTETLWPDFSRAQLYDRSARFSEARAPLRRPDRNAPPRDGLTLHSHACAAYLAADFFLSRAIVPNATHSNYFRVIASLHCDNVRMWNFCGPVEMQQGELRPV